MDSLSAEMKALEPELRAALTLQEETKTETTTSTDTPEKREYRALVDKASIGRIFHAAIGGPATEGPDLELQQANGLAMNMVPLDLIEERQSEERARATFTAGGEPQNQAPIISKLFPQSVAAFAGVQFERVPVGERTYPVLTTGATVATPAKSAAAAESTAAFTITNLGPKRAQASFAYSIEDAATFPSIDAALRSELSAALEDKIDERVLNTTDEGLLTFPPALTPATPAAETAYAGYVDAVYGSVDGTYAGGIGDIRLIVGAAIYAHMAKTYRANETDRSALNIIMAESGGVRVGGNVPAYASNRQDAVTIRGTGRRNAVVPHVGRRRNFA